MKALVIGGAGFVGRHLIEYLYSLGNIEVFATKLETEIINLDCIKESNIITLNILDHEQVERTINNIKPNYVFHLAAQSSVSLSWERPLLTYNVNILGTINILESVKKHSKNSRVLVTGSAEEYGIVSKNDLPINEELSIKPCNHYAISKASQEMASRLYFEHDGVDIIMVRAFNQLGPGQDERYVIPDFVKQLVKIKNQKQKPEIFVGNIDITRDFTDVRDVVKGYYSLMIKGISGEIYNIGSGKGTRLGYILEQLFIITGIKAEIIVSKQKFRPNDIEVLYSDISKIKKDTGWAPLISLEQSLEDIYNYEKLR